jgi:hypothetical protein
MMARSEDVSKSIISPVLSSTSVELRAAHGRAHVLAVGISDYSKVPDFHSLRVCANDAEAVRNCFHDIEQLNGDKSHCKACTSKSHSFPPTRGEILRLLQNLAEEADADNRIILYYSGHGHRLQRKGALDEFYLVPEDAYRIDQADALISFREIISILNTSQAKQKLVILDACLSGPDTKHLKLLPADLSPKFLKEYLETTTGSAVLSSCGIDETATIQSPNSKLSLFTHYLCEALGGNSGALDNGRLTLPSLYSYLSIEVKRRAKSYHQKQNPTLNNSSSGVIILGDFRPSPLSMSTLDFDQHPVAGIEFRESEDASVKEVLTEIKKWSYSQDYLERVVNGKLAEHFEERLGKFAASISSSLEVSLAEVVVEDAGVQFPDGGYSIEYKATSVKEGVFRHTVWFGEEWFGQSEKMVQVLHCLGMSPDRMKLELRGKHNLDSMVASLRARGWKLESNLLPKKFEVTFGDIHARVTPTEIYFKGFYPEDILGSKANPETQTLIRSVLLLLSDHQNTE